MSSHSAAAPDPETATPLHTLAPELTFPQFERSTPFDPPQAYTELSGRCPVAPVSMADGKPSWLITSFEGVRTTLSDPRFSSDMSHPGFPNRTGKPVDDLLKDTLGAMDGERHRYYRRMLTGELTVRRAKAMRPVITQITDEALDQLAAAGPGADLVKHVAFVVPSRVACHLVGIPLSDYELFTGMAATLMDSTSSDDQFAALQNMVSYFDTLVTDREHHDRDDLLGHMVRRYLATGELTRDMLIRLAWTTMAAGQETTAHMIGLGVAALLRHPDQLELLRREPHLLPGAVDELMRYLPLIQFGIPRLAMDDVEVDGQTVTAGEGVVALPPLANRDPAVFERPDELDVRRNARQHLTFGYGPHQCPAHALARLELEVVYGRLLERFPTLRLADSDADLKVQDKDIMYRVSELAVTW